MKKRILSLLLLVSLLLSSLAIVSCGDFETDTTEKTTDSETESTLDNEVTSDEETTDLEETTSEEETTTDEETNTEPETENDMVYEILNSCDKVSGHVEAANIAIADDIVRVEGNGAVMASGTPNTTGSLLFKLYRADNMPLSKEQLLQFDEIQFSVFVNFYLAGKVTLKLGSMDIAPLSWGWNTVRVDIDDLIREMEKPENIMTYEYFFVHVTFGDIDPNLASTYLYFDNVIGVYNQKVELGNVLIFGDSYSTFEGYIPEGYDPWYLKNPLYATDVNKVEQTWWHQLMRDTNSNLLLNCSFSGTTICNTGYFDTAASISFITRMDKLIADGYFENNDVDTVFIFGGTNDLWAGAPVGNVKYGDWTDEDKKSMLPALCYMIDKLQKTVPDANIILIINNDTVYTPAHYKGFKIVAEHYGVDLIPLQTIAKSSGHPSIVGMTDIKDQVLGYLYLNDVMKDDMLFSPEVSVSESGLASWKAVDNAVGYLYRINGGEEKRTSKLSVQLSSGDTIEVKALGDGSAHSDGNWSDKLTYVFETELLNSFDVQEGAVEEWNADFELSSSKKLEGEGAIKVTSHHNKYGESGSATTVLVYLLPDGEVLTDKNTLLSYDKLRISVYADESLIDTPIFLGDVSVVLGYITKAGWNELTVDMASVPVDVNANTNQCYIRMTYTVSDGVHMYFDNLVAVKTSN